MVASSPVGVVLGHYLQGLSANEHQGEGAGTLSPAFLTVLLGFLFLFILGLLISSKSVQGAISREGASNTSDICSWVSILLHAQQKHGWPCLLPSPPQLLHQTQRAHLPVVSWRSVKTYL